MQHNIQKTGLDIQYVTDRYGNRVFVQIPVAQWEIIRAQLPDLEEAEHDETAGKPEIIDRQGILVVRANATRDLTNVVREERERRVTELMGRIQG